MLTATLPGGWPCPKPLDYRVSATAIPAKEAGAAHPAVRGAAYRYLMDANKRRNVRVIMPYADALDRLAGWFVQLWAESLGKDGKDSTPTAP